MMKCLILTVFVSLGVAQYKQTINSPLPGTLTKSNHNLKDGIASTFEPSDKDLSYEDMELLKAFRPAL
jgi:hypothetical protein